MESYFATNDKTNDFMNCILTLSLKLNYVCMKKLVQRTLKSVGGSRQAGEATSAVPMAFRGDGRHDMIIAKD